MNCTRSSPKLTEYGFGTVLKMLLRLSQYQRVGIKSCRLVQRCIRSVWLCRCHPWHLQLSLIGENLGGYQSLETAPVDPLLATSHFSSAKCMRANLLSEGIERRGAAIDYFRITIITYIPNCDELFLEINDVIREHSTQSATSKTCHYFQSRRYTLYNTSIAEPRQIQQIE